MIIYDENGNYISKFLKRYSDLKSVFSEFKKLINSELGTNDQLNISIKRETEIDITFEFADRKFLIEFLIVKTNERNFLGNVIFSEIPRNSDEKNIKIDQAYFDGQGNVKESPSAKYSDINLKQTEPAMSLLKYWIVKFIETNIKKAE